MEATAQNKIDWFSVGLEYREGREERVLGILQNVNWLEAVEGLEVAMMPGEGIKAAIKEFKIPRVSHIAISHEFAPYGLYGIRGHYKGKEIDIFMVDTGTCLTPIAAIHK